MLIFLEEKRATTKESSRSISKIKVDRDSKAPVEHREVVKKTPIREPSKDKREPTPREKSSLKEEKKEPTKDRDDGDREKKREKEKRRDKRSASAEFEGDLSSVSNSSNGSSMPLNNDVVIVDDQRGEI